jgi:hypothetical protein
MTPPDPADYAAWWSNSTLDELAQLPLAEHVVFAFAQSRSEAAAHVQVSSCLAPKCYCYCVWKTSFVSIKPVEHITACISNVKQFRMLIYMYAVRTVQYISVRLCTGNPQGKVRVCAVGNSARCWISQRFKITLKNILKHRFWAQNATRRWKKREFENLMSVSLQEGCVLGKSHDLKGQGHDFRFGQKWYVWIDLNPHRVRQLFNIFLTLPLGLFWINKFLAA